MNRIIMHAKYHEIKPQYKINYSAADVYKNYDSNKTVNSVKLYIGCNFLSGRYYIFHNNSALRVVIAYYY